MPENAQPAPPPPAPAADVKEPQKKPAVRPRVDSLPPYNVVLLNDDDHTFEYVIEMLGKLFGHPEPTAEKMALEVDQRGRVIVLTTHKERAELKRDQITAYGADVRSATSKGSMSAVIEAAESK